MTVWKQTEPSEFTRVQRKILARHTAFCTTVIFRLINEDEAIKFSKLTVSALINNFLVRKPESIQVIAAPCSTKKKTKPKPQTMRKRELLLLLLYCNAFSNYIPDKLVFIFHGG